MLKYEPKFEFNADTQNYHMIGPPLAAVREDIILAFHKDVEGKIRQALIDLGWTPPDSDVLPSRLAPVPSVQKSSRNG